MKFNRSGRQDQICTQLYDECVDVLLERWNEAKKLRTAVRADVAREVLQPLALWMHEEKDRTQARAEQLAPVVEQSLLRANLSVEPDNFLRSIRNESGLLTGWGGDRFGFMHLGFQEYLAALEIRSREIVEPGPFRILAQRFGDSWWQEVILLLLAQRGPPLSDRFMQGVLRCQEFSEWAASGMMDRCLIEAAGLTAQPFADLIRGGDDAHALAARQLAAARVLARWKPKELEGLAQVLEHHPEPLLRGWWSEYTDQRSRGGPTVIHRTGIELVRIPAGSFLMGSAADDEQGFDDERPQHEVALKEFYLARTPVTNAQYERFLAEHPDALKPKFWADRNFNQPDQPVVGVSWDEAMAYCEWAGLVLPTEAQWEYACRAGKPTRYWSGDAESDLARVGWYVGSSDGRLHAVGEKEANPFGLYDMHGNVWEWCRDGWPNTYETEPRPGDGLRREPAAVGERVIRGGGWYDNARFARSAYRVRYHPGYRSNVLGFRPAQVIP